MLAGLQFSCAAFAVASLLFLRFILQRHDPKVDQLWDRLEKVEVPSGVCL